MSKLQIRFGEPEYHWLPVRLTADEFSLEFEASSVLNNPIEQLIETLVLVSESIDSEMLWYLEPLEYIFEFEIRAAGISLHIIEKAEGWSGPEIYRITGDFHSIVLPFWRAIKARFANQQFQAMHWIAPSAERLHKLDTIIRVKKLS